MSGYDAGELVPLGVYQARAPISRRMAALMGVLWGGTMLAFIAWLTRPAAGMLMYEVAIVAIAAAFFAAANRRAMVRKTREMQARLHGGDPALVPPQPAGRFDARVLSTLVRGRLGVSGQLYVGEYEWVFVPHLRNLSANRARIVLGPADEMKVDVVEQRPGVVSRLLIDGPFRRVRIAGRQGELLFITPDAPFVADELNRRAAAARANAARLEQG